jgi:hypothetical protein
MYNKCVYDVSCIEFLSTAADVPANSGFLRDKSAVLRDMIKRARVYFCEEFVTRVQTLCTLHLWNTSLVSYVCSVLIVHYVQQQASKGQLNVAQCYPIVSTVQLYWLFVRLVCSPMLVAHLAKYCSLNKARLFHRTVNFYDVGVEKLELVLLSNVLRRLGSHK